MAPGKRFASGGSEGDGDGGDDWSGPAGLSRQEEVDRGNCTWPRAFAQHRADFPPTLVVKCLTELGVRNERRCLLGSEFDSVRKRTGKYRSTVWQIVATQALTGPWPDGGGTAQSVTGH